MARTKQTLRTPTPKALSPLPPSTQPILRQGSSAVAYHIPDSPTSSTNPTLITTIALPRYSKWTSELHFHISHTEYLHLVRGSIYVYLDGATKFFSAKAGGEVSMQDGRLKSKGLVIEVPRYARHEWMRADASRGRLPSCVRRVLPEDVEDEVVVEEWTDPSDLGKPLFFWNLNAIITAPEDAALSIPARGLKMLLGNWWVPFQLFVVFWDLDNWPVFSSMRGTGGSTIEYVMTFLVLFTAKALGWLVGVRAVEKKRTPDAIWQAYKKHGVSGST
ncbi:hypothetical protein IQ06DRAFT_52738 [Phaeosphaeriaceae sp. SRC1lsM3a]|nr:hypothetical protein IQ06DRAFT_52738 [Stagonospora sp. SRC1lsM3a]